LAALIGVLTLLIGLVLPLDIWQDARAAQTATTTVALNLRTQPTTSSAIVLVMPAGATVEITGAAIGDWYPVTYNGSVGYASGAYLRLSPPDIVSGASARVLVSLNLRAGPGTSFARLAVMPAGAIVILTGEVQSEFWRLTYQGTMGWASSEYLELLASVPTSTATSTVPSPTTIPPTTVPPTTVPPTTVASVTPTTPTSTTSQARTNARLNLRSGAGTNFPVITIIPNGAIVDLLGVTLSGFQQVRYAGYEGWAFGTYLVPVSGGSTVTTTTANVNLRQGPSTVQAVILVIPAGSQVALTGAQAAGFHQVTYNGVTGWVSSAYLAGTGVPPGTAPLEIPVLMYHRIASTPGLYQVTEQTLRNQMAWLAANGYTSVTPDDVMAYLQQGTPLPAKPIMITIDDGNSSDVLFKQILDQYGFAGVWYLTGPTLPYAESIVRSMDDTGQVCGHTVSHPDLTGLGYTAQYNAIQNNKAYLERIVGHPINCFAYPYGAYNTTTMDIVTSVGYTNAVDAWGGPLKFTAELDRYHLTRINLSGFYTLQEFIGLVS
jgi:uncharacterized protein YraI/peptidoglycan/xylan/chitin deacetylase (PgdA/CDA1 family)